MAGRIHANRLERLRVFSKAIAFKPALSELAPVAVALFVVEEACPTTIFPTRCADEDAVSSQVVDRLPQPRFEVVLGGGEEVGHGGKLAWLNSEFHSVFNGFDARIRSAFSEKLRSQI